MSGTFTGNDVSPEIGQRAFLQIIITEDATSGVGSGGIQSVILGSFGKGKSTLLCWIAVFAQYLTKGSRDSYIYNSVHHTLNKNKYVLKPTTVIWRARDLDIWPVLIPKNFRERVPGITPKEVAVFVHKHDADHVTLFTYDQEHQPIPIPNMPAPRVYTTADDLIGQFIVGGINVVIEPQAYRLSERLCNLLREARTEYDAGGEAVDEEDKDYEDGAQKRNRGRPPKITDYSQHACKTACFWFDCVNATMQLFGNKPIQFLFDEGDDFLSSASADAHWWLCKSYTENMRDFRRANLSTCTTSHGWNMLVDDIYKRATHKILLPGIRAGGKNTMIQFTSVINRMLKGQMIVEISNQEYGVSAFSKIPNVIPCKINGLKGNFKALTEEKEREIQKIYKDREAWDKADAVIDLGPNHEPEIVLPEGWALKERSAKGSAPINTKLTI